MKKIQAFIAALCLFFTIQAQDVYVSTTGDDANSGTKESPFLTIERAVEAVEGTASGKNIWIKGGSYHLEAPINLSSAHNGVTIRAVAGEEVYVTGGKAVPGHIFRALNDTEKSYVPIDSRGSVMVADLPQELAGLFPDKSQYNKMGGISWNGYLLNIAQFPNKGFGYISKTLDSGPTDRTLPYSEENPIGGRFQMREDIDWAMMNSEFNRTKDMLIEGYINNDWLFEQHRVGSIKQSEKSIQLLRWTHYILGNDHISLPRRVRIKNALCQLDQPGEWYFDQKENKLYLWPIQPPNSQNPITILDNTKFVNADKTQNITIRDITFQNFGDLAIHITNSEHTLIAGCTFRSSTGMGVRLHGTYNGIQSCDFYNTHQAFVLSGYTENRQTLTPEHNYARNNHMRDATFKGYGYCAVLGVGVDFSNNLVHDMNGAPKFADANDLRIEKNEFYNMGYEMGDWNMIYSNDDYATRGNYIRYNFFHHLMETPQSHGLAAVRQDGEATGYHVESNIMYKTGRAAVQVFGADGSVAKNLVLETPLIWHSRQAPYDETDRSDWETKSAYMAYWYQKEMDLRDSIAAGVWHKSHIENRIGQAEDVFGKEGWLTNELWKSKYPNLEHTFDLHDPNKSAWTNSYMRIEKNYTNSSRNPAYALHGHNDVSTLADIQLMLPNTSYIEEQNNINPDDVFNNPDAFDFTFKNDFTPVDGFEKWDFNEVGLYLDEYRTTMPDKYEYRMAIKDKYEGVASSGGSFDYDKQNERYSDPEYLSLVSDYSLLDESPLLYLPFDETEGGRAHEQMQGHDAFWQNADTSLLGWESGVANNSAHFGGESNSYFRIASDSLIGKGDVSFTFWMKYEESTSVNPILFTGTDADNQWGFYMDGSELRMRMYKTDRLLSSLLANQWYFVGIHISSVGVSFEIFDTPTGPGINMGTLFTGTDFWNIGANMDGTEVFKGNIDDFAFYDRWLPYAELELIYKEGLHGKGLNSLMPVSVQDIKASPDSLKLRERFTGQLSASVQPSNAANQAFLWSSSDPSIVTVDEAGNMEVLSSGQADLIVSTVDGNLKDTCKITVVEQGEKLLPMPVAYWPMDEQGGSIVEDVIGGLNGIWSDEKDPDRVEGLFGYAPRWTGGINDRFVVTGDPLQNKKQMTISTWFKLYSTGQYEGLVTTRAADSWNNWGMSAEKDHIDARYENNAIDSESFIGTGTWYNVVMTWDSSGQRSLYIDGELFKTEMTDIKDYLSNEVWYFGDDVCCNGREINGHLDDVVLFDTALTASDVAQISLMGEFGSSVMDMISTFTQGIMLLEENISLAMGEEMNVVSVVEPMDATNKAVTWRSLDENIATVNYEGLIVGVNEGDTKVISTTVDGGFTDTVRVNVYRINAESVRVDPETLSLSPSGMAMLTATVLPENATDKSYTWASEDVTIATVSEYGQVKALKEGTTSILATTVYGNVVGTCDVTVEVIHVDSVTVSEEELILEIGEKANLTATVYPDDAQDKSFIWTSDNSLVATISLDGEVEGRGDGVTKVKAFTWDMGRTAECVVKVGDYVGIDGLNSEGLSVYPNPATDCAWISGLSGDVKRVEVYDVHGRIIEVIEELGFEHPLKIDVSSWEKGVYMLKVVGGDRETLVSLVK